MGLFSRLKIGFGMARRSGRVLRAHPKLLVFPLVGGASGVAFLLTLFGSLFLAVSVLQDSGPALYAALFVAYLVETFIASFFTAGLVSATDSVFHGEEVSVRDALGEAWDRKGPLLAWAVIAAVVGVVIRIIESQDNVLARILAGLFAVAWSVMTYFVVPVIVFRDPSVRELFAESARTFKETWGESIGAMGAIDVVTFLLVLAGAALGVLTLLATAGLGPTGVLLAITVGGTAVITALLIGKALTGIAKTALYVYATEDTAPEYFDDMDFGRLGGDGTSGSRSAAGPGTGRI